MSSSEACCTQFLIRCGVASLHPTLAFSFCHVNYAADSEALKGSERKDADRNELICIARKASGSIRLTFAAG